MRDNRPTSAKVHPPRSGPDVPDGSRAVLIEVLERLEKALTPTADDSGDPTENTILLDREIGGFRYLLVRAPSHARESANLSPREQEIVRMVAAGHPNKIIADILEISSWTVSTHLRRIFAKLGVASRAAMVAKILNDATINPKVSPLSRRPPL
jgi:DNA-binding CsgD family transcriptional regulator